MPDHSVNKIGKQTSLYRSNRDCERHYRKNGASRGAVFRGDVLLND